MEPLSSGSPCAVGIHMGFLVLLYEAEKSEQTWTCDTRRGALFSSTCVASVWAGVINDQLYVVGGFTERDQDAGPTAEAYNPEKNQWSLISSMKISMELYDSAVLDNKFYVVNSSSENLVGLVYDPKMDEWVYMAHGLNTGDFNPKNHISSDLHWFVYGINHRKLRTFNSTNDHNGYVV